MGIGLYPGDVAEMRAWAGDCVWADLESAELDELDDSTILRGIERHYVGTMGGRGVTGFLEDLWEARA